jgi:GT2 family glycosyltransferase
VDEISSTARYAGGMPAAKPSGERMPLAARVRIPSLLRGMSPPPVRNVLRKLRVRILMREFRRHREVVQSIEDASASEPMSIVVPVHDAPAVTRRCLVVETEDIIQDFIGRNGWRLVRHETPLGHSVACEAGASLATRPYLCLLNSDTVVTPSCWRLLKEVFEHDNNIAVAGPSTSHSSNPQTLPVALYLRHHWNDNQICDFAMRLLAKCPDPDVADLSWASGFAIFIRLSVWKQLGGFDRNLPDYGNEKELCNRVATMGYRRVWVRNAYIHHLGGQSYCESIGENGIIARKVATSIYIEEKKLS